MYHLFTMETVEQRATIKHVTIYFRYTFHHRIIYCVGIMISYCLCDLSLVCFTMVLTPKRAGGWVISSYDIMS